MRADYDERYRRFSPGSVVDYFAISESFRRSEIVSYDSCADDYGYLRNWTDKHRRQRNIHIFKSGVAGGCLYGIEYQLRPLLKRIFGR